jgi:hypothetical protein
MHLVHVDNLNAYFEIKHNAAASTISNYHLSVPTNEFLESFDTIVSNNNNPLIVNYYSIVRTVIKISSCV